MAQLNGKTAIVLGAAGRDNMGQHIAKRFAAEGAKVVVSGRQKDELDRFAKTIGGAACACDITSKADLEKLVAFARKQYGPVDIAVNATGWGLLAPFLENSEADLDKIMDLQFTGEVPNDLGRYGVVVETRPPRVRLEVPRQRIPEILTALLANYSIEDVGVQERPLEDVIAEMFASAPPRTATGVEG